MGSMRSAVCNHSGPLLLEFDALNKLFTKLSVTVLLKDMDTLYLLQSSLEYLICFQRTLEIVLVLLCSSAEEHVVLLLRISFLCWDQDCHFFNVPLSKHSSMGKHSSHYLRAEVLLCSSDYQSLLHEC